MGAQWRREMQGLVAGCGGGGLDAYMVCMAHAGCKVAQHM